MRRALRRALTAALPLAVLAGCHDYLTNPEAVNNPNQPTAATPEQLFVGVETNITLLYTSDIARTSCMWVQACEGSTRQYKSLGTYTAPEDTWDPVWSQVFASGGIIDVHKFESMVDQAGNQGAAGMGRVLEALLLLPATDLWGALPFTDSLPSGGAVTPADTVPQSQMYQIILAKLDTAITDLTAASSAGAVGGVDIFFPASGDANLGEWARLAHTLKARTYLHMVECDPKAPPSGGCTVPTQVAGLSNPAQNIYFPVPFNPTMYQNALTEAQAGLKPGTSPTTGETLRATFSTNPNELNPWFQFWNIQRSGYIAPGAYLVSYLEATNAPMLGTYFTPVQGSSNYVGLTPGTEGGSGFSDFNATGPNNPLNETYATPLVSWWENQLIIAEAAHQLGQGGTAATAFNLVRTAFGQPTIGSPTLTDIMLEKYATLFQNYEVWNDYKRTCLPLLKPAGTATEIPGRFLYPQGERITNPNIPTPSQQSARNANDPDQCPAGPSYNFSTGTPVVP